MYTLENDYLIIESKSSGAELTRIYSKKYKKEILWDGDAKHWGRQSPVLFPIVGRLKNNETIIEDSLCKMGQHGFARDMNFELLSTSQESITYKLTSANVDKNIYPYDFELYITYTLLCDKVNIKWEVKNTDSKEIYFSIGAHPAFNISSADDLDKYSMGFKCRENVKHISLVGPYHDKFKSVKSLNNLNLYPNIFENDALIYTDIDEISLKNKESNLSINVLIKDFPLVGIWTPYYKESNSTAPFICIEPWYGLADGVDSNNIYKDKKYINKLNISETFSADYSIEIK
ncbi:MAG: aldose 1-epimerase family protein [Terrisporobacter sp.]